MITTTSPRNFDLVKSLGADAVFDYNEGPAVGKKIREYTDNKLHHVFDCISTDSSVAIVAEAFSSDSSPENHYSGLLKQESFPRPGVNFRHTLMYTSFGETFFKGPNEYKANAADYEFAKKFWALAEKLIAEKKVKTHPSEVRQGSLNDIFDG